MKIFLCLIILTTYYYVLEQTMPLKNKEHPIERTVIHLYGVFTGVCGMVICEVLLKYLKIN